MNKDATRIHVIFKTHLDIGYTDLAKNVTDRYMKLFFPKAIQTAEYFNEHPEKGSFIWTTGSWLIHHLLKHGTDEEKQQAEEAIAKDYLRWHGLPFTTYTELYDSELLDYSIQIAKRLDQRFGKRTIAAKMTDVPGHTRSLITHMAMAGLKYLHLGVNPSSHVPHVPEMFLWQNTDGSEIVVQYSKDYGTTFEIEGLNDILYFAHTHDNHGPSTVEQIEAEFAQLREAYPHAEIKASTLDEYAEKVWEIRDTLPVVEEEIGDSWIHGSATDPYKLACYRELLRLKRKWLQDGTLNVIDEEYKNFCDELIMIPEHTWGVDIKRYLADYIHYDKDDFQEARKRDKVDISLNPLEYRFYEMNSRAEMIEMFGDEAEEKLHSRSFSLMERSWLEQRKYLDEAIKALHPERQAEAQAALSALIPSRSILADADGTSLSPDQPYVLGDFEVVFEDNGAIVGLKDAQGREWAGPDNQIGLFSYETYSQADYDRWYREYHVRWRYTHVWATGDFGKPGMDLTKEWITHEIMTPKLQFLQAVYGEAEDVVIACLRMPRMSWERMGAPRELTLEYIFKKNTHTVECKLQWFDKDAYRLPEASWMSFNPIVNNPNQWKLDKIGQRISPHDVVKGGNRNMHAVQQGMYYAAADGEVHIDTLDAALVCPGEPRLVQFDHTFAPLSGGMHVNLHNNVWGTNFQSWYEEDALFRFKLQFQSHL
ncbi:DUF5054 domain-containing protein [Paenibacillus sp. 1001270B_150601_E10]|uniref:DUF5054 domain-containing protein n=1 Tax=Paenibacillus sp. 1001270B_150601_E10 TaxID=2787079 RepID=UPI001E608FBD|nr:DUF5054 domain-containing protein [Paenibacillus sp. 1001270B_150601_E10]